MAEQQPLLGSGGSTDASSDRAAVGAIDAAKRKKKEKSIMKSSLDIVFSYTRSQQILYGSHLPSAPSFVDQDPYDSGPSNRGSLLDPNNERRRRWTRFRKRQADAAAAGVDIDDESLDEESGEYSDEDDEGSVDEDEDDDEGDGDEEWRKPIEVDPDDSQDFVGIINAGDSAPSSPGVGGRFPGRLAPSGLGSGSGMGMGSSRAISPRGSREEMLPPPQPLVSAGPGRDQLMQSNTQRPSGYGAVPSRWNSTRTITSSNAFGESLRKQESMDPITPIDGSFVEDDNEEEEEDLTTPTASHISVFRGDDSDLLSILEQPGGNSSTANRQRSNISLRLPSPSNLTTPTSKRSQKRRRSSVLATRDSGLGLATTNGNGNGATPMTSIPEDGKPRIRRRSSAVSRQMSLKGVELGKSTSGQTMFNCIAVLVGIGVLSEPLAFAYCGWIGGTLLLIFFGVVTNYTAKLLAGIILADASLSGYSDMGIKAFGKTARLWVDVLFCVELFALSTAWIVIFGDSLHSVLPQFSADIYKVVGFFVVLPTTLLPLRLLSIPSLLSLISSFAIIVILLIDGFSKTTAPGSILHPTETSLLPDLNNANVLGGLGLLIAGFGGHAIIPSLAIDMRHPEKFNRVVNVAYIVASVVFFIAGAAGYLMFGNSVTDEVTRDLTKLKYGFSVNLNKAATWLIVLNPVTKFALCTRPLNLTIETVFSLNPSLPPTSKSNSSPSRFPVADPLSSQFSTHTGVFSSIPIPPSAPAEYVSSERRKTAWRITARCIVTAGCTAVAVGLPGFGRLMAFIGSFTTFMICVILPIMFYTKITPRAVRGPYRDTINAILMILCPAMMISGTVWSVWTGDRVDPDP